MKVFLDADMALYKEMAAEQQEWELADEQWTILCDIGICRANYLDRLDNIASVFDVYVDDIFQCFTGPSAFRKRIYPGYKANRLNLRKPVGYVYLKAELLREQASVQHDEIEADDVLGILASRSKFLDEPCAIVSGDKDLNQIAGLHYWPGYWERNEGDELAKSKQSLKDFLQPYGLIIHDENTWSIPPLAAQAFWYSQILQGDSVDNVAGCPGIGEVRARRAVSAMDLESPMDCWEKIVQQFEAAKAPGGKLGSFFTSKNHALAAAIQQAQLVRILRNVEYDWEKRTVDLWHPEKELTLLS